MIEEWLLSFHDNGIFWTKLSYSFISEISVLEKRKMFQLLEKSFVKTIQNAIYSSLWSTLQGDPNWNFLFQIAVSSKRSIFDPLLIKPKCVLGVADFFQFSAVCLQFSAVCLQFPKKIRHSSNPFWSLQHGVKYP